MSKRKQKRKQSKSVEGRLRFLGDHVDGFRSWLRHDGYRPTTIVELVRLLACWAEWLQAAGFALKNILAGYNASAAVFKGGKMARAPRGAGALFIRYLREQGALPSTPKPPSPTETWPILGAFRAWMQSQRGVTDSTLDTYQTTLVDLLKALGDDPRAFTTNAVRAFVLERTRPHSRGRAKTIATSTRAFLRFLVATGQCPAGRHYAVPRFANWQLASVPRFLAADDIERAIAACEGESRLRDRTIVLLLARLGLRASEVANLKLTDIDWRNGRLAIAGKSRREEWLPLTQEVGDAIIAYIEQARPRLPTSHLFFTDFAPIRPLTRTTVRCIVRRTLLRAGIRSVHRGAHVLRHSAATAMLRQGVSLSGVGTILRHRSPAMTLHYAKVDFGLLSEIAQPWVGRLSC
ncbi:MULTISPECIES: tyrosine-type recombinase/integrase [Bradyrhizobium]|uniref:tyrosine-type recombinase/integrase n=1 Tax=Bradyrhizobium TaxID=374 RepID=UPI000D64939F|nr:MULTISPECIES: tyrosine-type recombinase/integrase [Bradyrhizobium]MCA1414375.1 tyrosine-type recombinase/integrase [Bradyrhizobium sp. NBAIM20]MCA1465631.1 tyrosine-type recombinase/integrase [Bradyrhizobium sp. NBAIM18]MCA1530092.1 tyrosine-type recombinase/integrase [Bradyrhizobium yuanmingense]PWE75470.1 integrase [Bradyrhizobium sp. SUTN9-2]